MTQNEAFDILKLDLNATDEQIKKAFRKMAMEFHPDRNESIDAKSKFIEIHEAYTFLLNQNSKNYSDIKYNQYRRYADKTASNSFRNPKHNFSQSNFSQPNNQSFEERYENARRAADAIFEEKSKIIYQKVFDTYMQSNQRSWANFVAVFSLLLSMLFIADNFMPTKENYTGIKWFSEYSSYFVRFQNTNYEVDKSFYFKNYKNLNAVYFQTTALFKDVKYVKLINQNRTEIVLLDLGLSVTTTFPIIPLILLFPLISLFMEKPTFNFVFFHININSYVIPAFIIFLFLSNNRIFKLFSI